MDVSEGLEGALIRSLAVLERDGYMGYDPYDGLLSPLARLLPGSTLRLLFVHAVRKKPINIRPMLGIKKTLNPKTLALCLSAYAGLCVDRPPRPSLINKAKRIISLLQETFPWGYPFPWQSRAFFVPAGTPTAVNTAFVLHALADARDALNIETDSLIRKGAENILSALNRTQDGFFSYTPFDNYRIHNANLLLASALARAGFGDEAMRSAQASVILQRPDGSWPYGEDWAMFSYIDNFHTGFVVIAITSLNRTFGQAFKEPLERIVNFYEKNLFGPDGLPLWRLGKRYPLDVHTLAVSVGVMAELGKKERAMALADALVRLFMDSDGRFGYQRGRFIYNRINYARWGQAWGVWALAKACFP